MAKKKTTPIAEIERRVAEQKRVAFPVPMEELGETLTEEQRQRAIAWARGLTPEEKETITRNYMMPVMARKDNVEGFGYFYQMVHRREIPEHARSWVEGIYKAREDGKGIVIEAFRGSTKTTTVTITFTAFRIGQEPQRANLLVQVGDDIAIDNTAQISDIIENNPGWKLVFPHVVPDKEKGWGAGGYEVKRSDIPYGEWREMNAQRKDPTLVGVGYKSSEIIGKHPDGVMVIDDIHDEGNTASARELEKVRRILTGTIYPAMTPDTWKVFIGTPWVENDTLRYVAATGEYVHIKTPVYEVREDGEDEFEGRQVKLAWKERFDVRALRIAKKLAGSLQFARMFLLDLTAAANRVFKYQLYPASEIRWNWIMVGGCDYAGSMDAYKNKAGQGDYFALAYVLKLPGGGAVVADGVLARCTQAEAEGYIKRAQEIYPLRNTVVEGDGKGEEFIQVLRRNPGLRIIPMKTGGKGKAARLERQMGPWLENGTVRISDADTPFLVELRRELDNWPLVDHEDAMDGVYWALRGMPEVLTMPRDVEGELPMAMAYKKKNVNPYLSLGKAR